MQTSIQLSCSTREGEDWKRDTIRERKWSATLTPLRPQPLCWAVLSTTITPAMKNLRTLAYTPTHNHISHYRNTYTYKWAFISCEIYGDEFPQTDEIVFFAFVRTLYCSNKCPPTHPILSFVFVSPTQTHTCTNMLPPKRKDDSER